MSALYLLAHLVRLYHWLKMWVEVVLTVKWDLFGCSRMPIRFRGVCPYSRYQVDGASSEYERRVVAWFCRWHTDPTDEDWRKCLTLFGLQRPPLFTLRLWCSKWLLNEWITVREFSPRVLEYDKDGAKRVLRVESGGTYDDYDPKSFVEALKLQPQVCGKTVVARPQP